MNWQKAKVLVLGTFHMVEHEDLCSEKRQTEITELVSKLANFEPTKIAVEMVVEENEALNEKYRQYKLNTYNLEMNEIYQIGFRLGLLLGHEQIYPIDWMGKADMDYGEVETWAKVNQPELLSNIYEGLFYPELTENKSILDYYKEINEPVLLNRLHKLYVNISRIGDFNNYIGMNWLSWWYKRNLIMFSNLTRLFQMEEERILFIVGSSHSTIVNKFLEESEMCEVVYPLSYLY
ncbi:hypothetical protein EKG37_04535 [Robertmurraya yapensis]|uniref:TraB/GumN family protein n=1 Tax=Bacillus yapensis TaxID=2492960 RepID=A0A431WHZ6_9BACI|nr:DUF5694 domain-containing protein [Bacillus yapensis]RTR35156.1 hypothetical protein EKG37_04535 [Bacillus yapensis]TKS97665.1 hypothetical protein FAR12_04535 [Bacillus yapensis]